LQFTIWATSGDQATNIEAQLYRATYNAELVTESQDLKLEYGATAERRKKGSAQRPEYQGWRESTKKGQLSIYQSDQNLREPPW
jgi:hypothetical protein